MFIIIVLVEYYLRLDKDQYTEDEKNDAQEERKRRAEETREVRKFDSYIYLLYSS
jgi:hypothetical protein